MPPIPAYCHDCKKYKNRSQFSIKINGKPYSYCKDCNNRQCREANARRKGSSFKGHILKQPDPSTGIAYCSRCKTYKSTSEFHKNKARKSNGLCNYCKPCAYATHFKGYLKFTFGMEHGEYERMLEKQNGVCAICSQPESVIHLGKVVRLSVDHCHKTNKVRQLLCYACNHLVGFIERHGIKRIRDAENYVKKHS